MQIFNTLFLEILEMSLIAGIVIIVVLFVRFLLKGLPKSYAYMLWIVVAFRLVIPISADSSISIFNLFVRENISSSSSSDGESKIKQNADKDSVDNIAGLLNQEDYIGNNMQSALDAKATENHTIEKQYSNVLADPISIFCGNEVQRFVRMDAYILNKLTFIWIAGIMALVAYTVFSHIQIQRKIRYCVRLYDNVYECDQIRSPFVYGMIRPKICLPFRMHAIEQQCILAHERYHVKRKDYLIKPFAYVLLMVYWFHPLVWIAYHFMCIDMEMSCDEKIISGFTIEMREEYSRLLLAFAANKRQRPVGPLAFGENNVMKRIKNILQYKKAARWKLAGGIVAVMLTMAACATDANTIGAETVSSDPLESKTLINNGADIDAVFSIANSTDVAAQYAKQNESGQEHHEAKWAENSMCDMELCSLDYADSDRIVFHISSGLFQYDLQEQRITRSIDLKALNCQEVQTGGKCRITVYQSSDDQLQAVIVPYPYSEENSYVYDLERDLLFTYDEELLDRYTLFDGLVSKYDLPEEDRLKGWRHAEYILPLGEHSYGVLQWDTIELVTMYYEAGGQRWEIFPKEQATLPKLNKQDDSFYQSVAMYSGQNINQCVMDYEGLYNMHDYAGICALSTGLEYSDEMQREFGERSDRLSAIKEVSHSEDEKEYLYQFSCGEDDGMGTIVYVNFKYIDGVGWRAENFPSTAS